MTPFPHLISALLSATGATADAVPITSTAPEARLAQEAPPEYPHWSGALALGATWTDGNSETTTFSGTFNAERRDEKDRWTFDAFHNYGTSKQTVPETTTNNYGGGAKYDYFATEKLYYLANASAKVDHVAHLDLRAILGAGVGYQWREDEKLKWGTEAGLSYIEENFDTAPPDGYLAARLASNLTYALSKTTIFEQIAEALPSLSDSEDFIAKVDNRLKFNITGKWIAQIQYVLDHDSSTPNFVEETDHRVVVGVGWSFGA